MDCSQAQEKVSFRFIELPLIIYCADTVCMCTSGQLKAPQTFMGNVQKTCCILEAVLYGHSGAQGLGAMLRFGGLSLLKLGYCFGETTCNKTCQNMQLNTSITWL